MQAPAWQVSLWVQRSPSLQAVPLATGELEHFPLAGSHIPAVWHELGATQTTALLPEHTPAWQVSVWVQASPSLHTEPLAFGGFEHTPVAGLHTPMVWHESDATQTTAVPEHTPAWHASFWVQALLSLHAVPSAFAGFEHVPVAGLHTPAVWH